MPDVVVILFLGLVAWGAVAGGAWGQGFAIFVALGYLENVSRCISKMRSVTDEPCVSPASRATGKKHWEAIVVAALATWFVLAVWKGWLTIKL